MHAAQSLRDAESYSMYSGAGIGGDKRPHFGNGNGSVFGVSTIGGPPGSLNTAPPGLYWGSDEHGNPILLQMPSHHGLVGGEQQQDWAGATSPPPPTPPAVTMSEVPGPRRTAPIGTLPEPVSRADAWSSARPESGVPVETRCESNAWHFARACRWATMTIHISHAIICLPVLGRRLPPLRLALLRPLLTRHHLSHPFRRRELRRFPSERIDREMGWQWEANAAARTSESENGRSAAHRD